MLSKEKIYISDISSYTITTKHKRLFLPTKERHHGNEDMAHHAQHDSTAFFFSYWALLHV